ncbi:MAG: ABC transporter ATP-binding protein [Planctomycetota bacterium]
MIKVTAMTKVYEMGAAQVRALDGVDLVIEEGEFVSITGASGSGKSTLMHLLGCLDRPTAGRYEFDGKPVHDLNDKQLARIRNQSIGFVFQTFNLINRTSALDNVMVPLIYGRQGSAKAAALEALRRVGLADRAKHKPSELSGGERQRVAIARAIVNHPRLILADEPTGNLDSQTGDQILEIFHTLHEDGATLVLVTHEMHVAAQGERLINMRDGKTVDDRPITAELRAQLLQSNTPYVGRRESEDGAESGERGIEGGAGGRASSNPDWSGSRVAR